MRIDLWYTYLSRCGTDLRYILRSPAGYSLDYVGQYLNDLTVGFEGWEKFNKSADATAKNAGERIDDTSANATISALDAIIGRSMFNPLFSFKFFFAIAKLNSFE